MNIVIDSNILFSILWSKNSSLREILFDKSYKFHAPNYLFVELFKHKERLMQNTKNQSSEVYEYLYKILNKIQFHNETIIDLEVRKQAYLLCKDQDIYDVPFVALSIALDAHLWTGDKKLIKHLEKLGFNNIFIY
jgi:predicted nucleic acid-binding protein